MTFEITDPNVKSLSFNVAFGSDEFPEYSSSSYVDVAGVWTGIVADAKNYALVNGDPTTPLTVINDNLSLGNFIDNRGSDLSIEYDGPINKQTIIVPIEMGVNVIRVGVADTGYTALEPPRDCRRPFSLSYAAMGLSSSMA